MNLYYKFTFFIAYEFMSSLFAIFAVIILFIKNNLLTREKI